MGAAKGRNRSASPCVHPAGCEYFSWILFIVSITPGNEDILQLELSWRLGWGCARQNRIRGLQEGRPICQESLKTPLGASDVI